MIEIERVDHVGIRVADGDRAIAFYGLLGFEVHHRSNLDKVIIIRNAEDVELNLICNADNANDDKNILIDVADKFPGLTHLALRVASIKATIETLQEHAITITQGPVAFEAGKDLNSEMALGFSFDAIKRALSIRNYRIYTSGNIVAHVGIRAFSKRQRPAEAIETMPMGKGTS